MDDALRMAMRDSMQQGQLDEEEKKAKALEAVKRSKSQNRPSILDIAPAVQDNTRVNQSGLVQEGEIPEGDNVDWDIWAEEAVRLGLPPGMVSDLTENAKRDPKVAAEIVKLGRIWQQWYKDNPEEAKNLKRTIRPQFEEDFPEDFGGDQGAF